MFVGMLIHGGIIAFIVLIGICMLFGDDKTKQEATKAGEEAAGCGCLIVIAVLAVIIFLAVRNSGF